MLRVAGCGLRGARRGSFDFGFVIWDFGLQTEMLKLVPRNAQPVTRTS